MNTRPSQSNAEMLWMGAATFVSDRATPVYLGFRTSSEDFLTILIHLKSIGLIKQQGSQWMLTPTGEMELSKMRGVRKDGSAFEPTIRLVPANDYSEEDD
jgi:hypothetical protein